MVVYIKSLIEVWKMQIKKCANVKLLCILPLFHPISLLTSILLIHIKLPFLSPFRAFPLNMPYLYFCKTQPVHSPLLTNFL